MINGISSGYSSYTSSSTLASTQSKRFQETLLSKLDADEDGSVSQEELSSALSSDSKDGITVSLSQAFSSLDSDDDDNLSAEELAAFAPPAPPKEGFDASALAEGLLGALDSDSDGAISSDELTTGLSAAGSSADSSKVFDALDTNKDGSVSIEELTAALQPQQPPGGMPPATPQGQASSNLDSEGLFSALDTDDESSASELSQADNTQTSNANPMSAQALNRMIAALGERYDTEGSQKAGRYLNTAA
ncbi:XopAW family type III secretion system calcium-binding effector [Pseudomonas sp. DTU_2021_1001937_2_SI_NGA_ILE_001]|uniref:XopAW family type III secretion system calcium-binding effector n=1 Tax=Pseudomonas sp. DTU_2021_1001937_2_SI_NGA_ILE_001 TaxID=3077589 RepID=UPI0028FC1F9C|nr:XopAW family type III secretion system calcium-binding effector [Pseudomonas sp. DTU_2021_1001937_2_SI_NGA_ILE_001]WNW10770.1 XopAW family type III secretion system calcium-binding effector [Pseudomonas sp. DTU_2021_1001937_2_SI_NGA_ILE_001]